MSSSHTPGPDDSLGSDAGTTPVERKPDGSLEARATHEKLIVLSTFRSTHDAQLLRIELQQHGIKSQLANELSTSLFGATVAGPSSAFWVEVLVLESDADRALEIKRSSFDSKINEEVEIPEWKCGCGETVDAGFVICWQCNAEYKPSEDG